MERVLSCLVALAAICPNVVAAQHGEQLCSRVSSNRDRAQCVQAVAGQRVDAAAAQLCSRVSSNRDIVACAQAVAGRSFDAGASQTCGRVSSNRDIVACAGAAAGRAFDAGALQVCARVSSNRDIVACVGAAADKSYAPEEVSLCQRESSNRGIVACIQRTGRPMQQARPAAPRQRVAPPPSTTTTLVNDSSRVVTRVYARAAGASRWPGSIYRGALQPGQQVNLPVEPGRWDVCYESANGERRVGRNFTLPLRLVLGDAPIPGTPVRWEPGECHQVGR